MKDRFDRRTLAAIAAGGALGAAARYGMAQAVHTPPAGFPWNTFLTNISGSFAIGLLLRLRRRAFVVTGFLGAYTTYSAFAVETDLLVKNGHAMVALGYASTSLGAGLVAVWIGVITARAFSPRPPPASPGSS